MSDQPTMTSRVRGMQRYAGFFGRVVLAVALLATLGVCLPSVAHAVDPTALAPIETLVTGRTDLVGVAAAPDGTAWVSDRAAGIVYRVAGGTATALISSLAKPAGLALDADGRLLIAEEQAGRVLRREANGTLTVLASGIKTPRWLAMNPDGSVYVSAHRLAAPDGADTTEGREILRLFPGATPTVVATGIRKLEGLARVNGDLIAATQGLASGPSSNGALLRFAVHGDGTLGAPATWVATGVKQPVGVVGDVLHAVYVSSKELTVEEDKTKRAIGKVHADAHLTDFGANFEDPQGLAAGADGALYLADGKGGRLLRFAPPAPPAVTPPAVTSQTSVALTGTTVPSARVDVFVNEATTGVSAVADTAGDFTLTVTLAENAPTTLTAYATTHGGDGLTSAAADAAVVHDGIGPVVTIDAPPAGAHVRGTVAVAVTATDAGSQVASVALTVDGQALGSTTTPAPPASPVTTTASWDTTTLGDGTHTLAAAATDRAGTPTTVSRTVTVDNTPPETTIATGPAEFGNATGVTVTFGGSDNLTLEAQLVFSWRVDGGAWSAFAASPTATLSALTDGAHTVEVKARDLAGNEDPSPATKSFTVDTAAPVVTIAAPADGAHVRQTAPVQAQATDPGSQIATLVLTVDGVSLPGVTLTPLPPAASITATTSWITTTVPDGPRTITATATDRAGTTASTTRTVTVDNTAPDTQITAGPAAFVNAASVTLTFAGTDNLTPALLLTFAWRLDGGAWSAFSSTTSVTLSALTDGPHTFEVKARDLAGNEDATPAVRAFTADTAPPGVVFHAPAPGAYVRESIAVRAQATDAGSGVAAVTLTAEGQALGAALSPAPPAATITATATWNTTTVADGTRTLGVSASDRAGNGARTTRQVIVDNTPPDTSIMDGPTSEINATSATFTFAGSDNLTPVNQLAFAWRLDGGAWSAFSTATSVTLNNLSETTHTFEVIARDLAGNDDPTPASRSFTVRLGPVLTSVTPTSGTIGTFVTIAGRNFEPGSTTVAFNGVAAVIRTITTTEITTTVPIGTSTGLVAVTSTRGTGTASFAVTPTGDFTLTAAPATPRVIAGDQTSISVAAGGSGSFTSLVSLSLSSLPGGAAAGFTPQLLAPGASSFVTIAAGTSVAPGTYELTVTGQAQVDGRSVTRTATFTLEVLAPGTQALTGRILTAESIPQPIPGVTVLLGTATTLTDAAGNFTLLSTPAGPNMLFVDGRTGSTPTAQFPIVETQVNVAATGATRVPFIIYLPILDTVNTIVLPTDASGFTTQEVKATTPRIPGLEITIPAGTRIIDGNGNPVTELVITPVPVDRSPMPFPPGITPPMLFAINPGGAVPSNPLPISFPNVTEAPPGTQADLYYFDLSIGDWRIWGTGTVSADGRQIVSDPGYGLPRLAWHYFSARAQRRLAMTRRLVSAGDPVDVGTGNFTIDKTDLVLAGRIPVVMTRSYRSDDTRPGFFGVGWNVALYDSRLTGSGNTLVLTTPDQNTVQFQPIPGGRWTSTESSLLGAVITQLPGEFNFQIRYKDGTTHRYDRIVGFANEAGLSAINDRNGNAVTLARLSPAAGQFGLISRVTEPSGRALTLDYDTAGRITSVTDPIGRVVRYTYDPQGRLETVTDPAGGVTRYAYDATHRMTTVTDPRNITYLTNEYDAAGRVIRQTEADGGVWTFTYSLVGATVAETATMNPRGFVTRYRFNSTGAMESYTDALGQTVTFGYAPGSTSMVSITDGLGRVVRYEYDAAGNVTKVTDPVGHETTFTYEPVFNRLLSFRAPLGRVTSYEYDAQGNMIARTSPAGVRTTLTYQNDGSPSTITDPDGRSIALTYDTTGNLTTVRDPLGHTSRRDYDAVSRLTRQIDPRGRATTWTHDELDRVTSATDALGGVTRFAYDPNGNVTSVTDPRGVAAATYGYDAMDRRTSRTDGLGRLRTFVYDQNGNVVQTTDANGHVATLSYDPVDRLIQRVFSDGTFLAVEYDAGGRLMRAHNGTGSVTQAYDDLNRLVFEATAHGTVGFEYDALQRRTRMSVGGKPDVTYAYDSGSRLVSITQAVRSTSIDYDSRGLPIRVSQPSGATTTHEYDAGARLVRSAYQRGGLLLGDLTYGYDAVGNRVSVGGSFTRTLLPTAVDAASYDLGNQQLSFGAATLVYDANGNVRMVTEPSGTTTYIWDAQDRLVASSSGASTISFSYDPLGRRVAQVSDGVSTAYQHAFADVIREIRGGVDRSYVRGLGLDQTLEQDPGGDILSDATRNTIALTNPDGSLGQTFTYEPFGRTSTSGDPNAVPYQFSGRERDAADLYYFRARYYKPSLARFLQPDPLGVVADIALYTYASNNPLTLMDPLGLRTYVTHGIWTATQSEQVQEFAAQLTVADPDVRLFGWSGNLGGGVIPTTSKATTDLVNTILADLATKPLAPGEKLSLVGHSAGGIVSINAAIALQGRGVYVDNLIVMGTPYRQGFPNQRIPARIPVTNFVGRYDPLSYELSGRHVTNIKVNTGDTDALTAHTGYWGNPAVVDITQGRIR